MASAFLVRAWNRLGVTVEKRRFLPHGRGKRDSSIIGAACFPLVFRLTNNKGRSASIFALLTGISMFCMYFFTVGRSPVPFYLFSCLAQFFFSGFNTAIYAIVPDCVEYGEWKTGLRNDGFQYAFISLGNKIGMAIGTSVLAGVLGSFGYVANQQQNPAVLAVIIYPKWHQYGRNPAI